ncbi:MAG TPA: kelch repeat-containing protein [Candidatus Kapabacteria bacterium]|nr:kelch repeat-containing protein [Candidatus Kapabacteria bacterium]
MRPLYPLLPVLTLLLLQTALHAQVWTQLDSLPGRARTGAATFVIGDTVYVVGGTHSIDCYGYCVTTHKWSRKKDVPNVVTERLDATAFTVGNTGYVGLGLDQDSVTLRDLWAYDAAADTWSQRADLPGSTRCGAFAMNINGTVYVGGGFTGRLLVSEMRDMYAYDPVQDLWTRKANIIVGGAFYVGAFVLGNYGYMATGLVRGTEIHNLYRYDPDSNAWSDRGPFPEPARAGCVAFTYAGKAYVGLGEAGFTELRTDIYRYDPDLGTWAFYTVMPGTPGRLLASAAVVGNSAYIGLGGDLDTADYGDWWQLDFLASGVATRANGSAAPAIAPNPSHGHALLTLPSGWDGAEVRLFDCLGECVGTSVVPDGTPTAALNVAGLAAGPYMVEIRSGMRRTTLQLIVQ